MAPPNTLEMEKDMAVLENTASPEQDSGPGQMDVLEARITLHLAHAYQAVQQLQLRLQELVEQPVHPAELPRRLRTLADQLEQALVTIRTLEDLQRGGQL